MTFVLHYAVDLHLAALGGADLLRNSQEMSQAINQRWDEQWVNVLTNGGLYQALTRLGTFFAVGTLLLFMVQFGRDMLENEITRPISSLIYPLVVAVLLANNGAVLADFTLGLRNMMQELNTQVLEITTTQASLADAFQTVKSSAAAKQAIDSLIAPCLELTGDAATQCLQEQEEAVEQVVQQHEEATLNTGFNNFLPLELRRYQARVREAIQQGGTMGELQALVGSVTTAGSKIFLLAFQEAFQNLLEVALLVTALLGPVAVGGSLLPVGPGAKAVVAWLTGMFSLGFAKICYSIIVGLASTVIVNAELGDVTGFLVLISILAPVFALGLASGGGITVYTSLQNALVSIGSAGIGTVMSFLPRPR
jgi:hypothetical protein